MNQWILFVSILINIISCRSNHSATVKKSLFHIMISLSILY